MRFLYNFLIRIFGFSVRLAAPFNSKASQWHRGRAGLLKQISEEVSKDENLIWFHCASLGEFEQGRPVIDAVKSTFTGHRILLTFFSPSGFEIRKGFKGADYIYYLPLDTAANARKFIAAVKPRMVYFVKYEFWFNYINELHKNKIPLFIVSAIFRKSQYFFKPGAGWARRQLQKVTYFFVQNEESLELLNKANVFHAEVSGDTRFDRVVKLADETVEFPEINSFAKKSDLFIAGSTWPPDEELLLELMKSSKTDFKLIIAPHIVNQEHVNQLLKLFSDFNPVLFSKISGNSAQDSSKVLIIDSIGKLSYLFKYAKFAYIGGGFGVGIHNTLEAATYGLPVFFGPNYKRFNEAVDMVKLGCAFPVENFNQVKNQFEMLLIETDKYEHVCYVSKKYVRKNEGVTQSIIEKTKEYLPVN